MMFAAGSLLYDCIGYYRFPGKFRSAQGRDALVIIKLILKGHFTFKF